MKAQQALSMTDLVVDAIYEGGRAGNAADDPLPRLLGVSNQGGFRYLGTKSKLKMVVLITSFADPNWPDELDPVTGIFTYFGDNKKPGNELHNTPRFGNQILRDLFFLHHYQSESRITFPPVLLFAKTGFYRDVKFLGLAVPGCRGVSSNEDLTAIWKSFSGKRFQNYRAKFTVLDVPRMRRDWIRDVQTGNAFTSNHVPEHWRSWVGKKTYHPLIAEPSVHYRTKAAQLPETNKGWAVINAIHGTLAEKPKAFEKCAGEIIRLMMPNVSSLDLTRPSRDGGRDAVGTYRLGNGPSSIQVEFAMEAKCYSPATSSVGVKETSRLISRLRHRQFGVLVTTSYVHSQAYRELTDDRHPVIVLAAKDIVAILRSEFPDMARLKEWLEAFK